MKVLQGRLCFEVEGQERVLTPADGEVCIEPWTHHRLLLSPPSEDPAGNRCVFLLSADDADQMFKLDEDFYENWYSYQEGIVVRGEKISIGMGRCLAAILGYQPYYREWTTDIRWDQACRKMENTLFQRRFAKRDIKKD
ncbi:hypothetical protein N0V82_007768 [Gnomoniopsis sp. IMI 355080]|nr:hypothetical protein N0V82_007768 [Gnomoniopsis sp. IMI 355080]